MAGRQMSFRRWREQLGEAITIEEAASAFRLTLPEIGAAARRGRLPVYAFRAQDGRVFRLIRVDDLLNYQQRRARLAEGLSLEGMRRAFEAMASR